MINIPVVHENAIGQTAFTRCAFEMLVIQAHLFYLTHLIQTGAQASRLPSPNFFAPDPSAFITQISVYSEMCPRSDEKAICLLSGDQVGY